MRFTLPNRNIDNLFKKENSILIQKALNLQGMLIIMILLVFLEDLKERLTLKLMKIILLLEILLSWLQIYPKRKL